MQILKVRTLDCSHQGKEVGFGAENVKETSGYLHIDNLQSTSCLSEHMLDIIYRKKIISVLKVLLVWSGDEKLKQNEWGHHPVSTATR